VEHTGGEDGVGAASGRAEGEDLGAVDFASEELDVAEAAAAGSFGCEL
jgi:hypothetical protein